MFRSYFLALFLALAIGQLTAATSPNSLIKPGSSLHAISHGNPSDSISVSEFGYLSKKQFEAKFGRKLSHLERMAFRRAKREVKQDPNWMSDERKVLPAAKLAAGMASLGIVATAFGILIAPANIDCEDDCSPLPIVLLILGAAALLGGFFMGLFARKKIKQNKAAYTGEKLAKLGIIAFIVVALAILALLLLL
jgi:hypothetical protein